METMNVGAHSPMSVMSQMLSMSNAKLIPSLIIDSTAAASTSYLVNSLTNHLPTSKTMKDGVILVRIVPESLLCAPRGSWD